MGTWLRRLLWALRASREDANLREEMEAHRAMRQAQMERSGLDACEAAAASRRALGNLTLAREDVREIWIVRWFDRLRQDVRVGVRMLLKHPGVTATAVLSLALGIGANAAVFSAVSKVVLERLPFRDPDRLVMIWAVDPRFPESNIRTTGPEYLAWKQHATLFEVMGTEGQLARDLGAEENGAPATRVAVQRLQSDLFTVLDVRPTIGRPFRPDEERVGAPAPVALLSDALWTTRYGRDPEIVGKTIRLDGVPTTIVGVMPSSFVYLSTGRIDVFAPFAFNASQVRGSGRGYAMAARLKAGVTLAQAQAEMDAVAKQVEPDLPPLSKGVRARVQPLKAALFGEYQSSVLLLQGIVLVVLLIACANVAGLLLARSTSRQTEIAVRAAIGAGRARIVRQLLTESTLLAVVGGVAGIGVAAACQQLLRAGPDWVSPLDQIGIDWRVLAFTLGCMTLTGLGVGILPAIQASRPDLVESLKGTTRGTMDSAARHRVRTALVVAQIAMAFVLLVGCGLLVNSFVRLATNDLGGDPRDVVTFTFTYGGRYSRPIGNYRGLPLLEFTPQARQMTDRVLDGLRQLPGVVSAAGTSSVPFTGGGPHFAFGIEGRDQPATDDRRQGTASDYLLVTRGFFSTIEVPIVRGRDFDERDRPESPWAAVINEAAAKVFWPHEDPIGQRITLDIVTDEQPREIVGIVQNFRSSVYERDVRPVIFSLTDQQPPHTIGPAGTNMRNHVNYIVRTAAGGGSLVTAGIRRMMADIDRDRPITEVRPLTEDINGVLSSDRYAVSLVSLFAGVATLLAAVGLYGVMSFTVGQRTREIGVRMALGASRADVIALVMRRVLMAAGLGVAAGVGGALLLTKFLTRLLWGVKPTDVSTFVVVSIAMMLIAVLAGWIPARRALRVAPTVALRAE